MVLDSSVGVKWVKPEAGREVARSLLLAHQERSIRIVVPALFLEEVVAVSVRHGGAELGEKVWSSLRKADLTSIGLDDAVANAAFDQCRLLGCTFYDSLAPALAHLLDATLYSADARAHAGFPDVVLI